MPHLSSLNLLRAAAILSVSALSLSSHAQTQPTPSPTPAPAPTPPTTPSPTPSQDPSLTDPSVDDQLNDLDRQRMNPNGVRPVAPTPAQSAAPSVPAPTTPTNGPEAPVDPNQVVPQADFFPEGALLVNRTGRVIVTPRGDGIFVPAAPTNTADPNGTAPANTAPVVLIPSQRAARLIASVRARKNDAAVTISGQSYVYRERPHMLVTSFTMNDEPAPSQSITPNTPTNTTPTNTQPAAPTQTTNKDPRVEELLQDLESTRPVPRQLDPNAPATRNPAATTNPNTNPDTNSTSTSQDPNAPTNTTTASTIAEGTIITSRRGRLVRLASEDGRYAFAMDNDPDSPATAPMVIVPCRALQALESLAQSRGEGLQVRMTGRILVADGKNYILPTMFQAVRSGEIKSGQ